MVPGQVTSSRRGNASFQYDAPEILVAAQRHARLVLGDRADRGEAVVAAELGVGGGVQELAQLALLRGYRVDAGQLRDAPARVEAEEGRQVEHVSGDLRSFAAGWR